MKRKILAVKVLEREARIAAILEDRNTTTCLRNQLSLAPLKTKLAARDKTPLHRKLGRLTDKLAATYTWRLDLVIEIVSVCLLTADLTQRLAILKLARPEFNDLTEPVLKAILSQRTFTDVMDEINNAIFDAALEATEASKLTLAADALHAEVDAAKALQTELDRAMATLAGLDPGTKAYSACVKAIKDLKDQVDAHVGLDRVRRRQNLSDKASVDIMVHESKLRLDGKLKEVKPQEEEIPQISQSYTDGGLLL